MRACRLFGYTFVASTPLAALQGELVHLNLLPICCQLGHHLLTAELVEYKRLADQEIISATPDTVSSFWNKHALHLKTWFKASRDVALITPSSATAERVFSLLSQGFDKSQQSALEDYKSTSVMLRYNAIWEKKQ